MELPGNYGVLREAVRRPQLFTLQSGHSMENGKKPIFPLPQQPLLTQQVVTAVTLHLTKNPLCSLRTKETVVQIDTGGDYFPCERAAKITAARPQNQRCRIHCCGVSLSFHWAERQCSICTLTTFSERCKQCFQCRIVLIYFLFFLLKKINSRYFSLKLLVFSFKSSFSFRSSITMTRRATIISFLFSLSASIPQVQTGLGQRAGNDSFGNRRLRRTWVLLPCKFSKGEMLMGQIWRQEQLREATRVQIKSLNLSLKKKSWGFFFFFCCQC